MRSNLDFEYAGYSEAAALAIDADLNRHELRVEGITHGLAEDREASSATRAPVGDLCQGVALCGGSALFDVDAQSPAALMNGPRPRCRVDEVDPVESDVAVAAIADVVPDERFASATRWNAAEVARASEIAIAGLDIVCLKLPRGSRRHAEPPDAASP